MTRSLLGALVAAALVLAATAPALAATQPDSSRRSGEHRVGLRDSLDGALDLSDQVIEAHGFIPVPIVITEPALGGFGGGAAVVFLTRQPPIEFDHRSIAVPPDITVAAGLYTANDTWLAGGGRMATLRKRRLRYRVIGGYADMNLDFYQKVASGKDQAFSFNGLAPLLSLSLLRLLRDPRFVAGGQYTVAAMDIGLAQSGDLPPFATGQRLEGTVALLGPIVEFDGRDNIFTPDHGFKLHADVQWADDWLGSDYRFGRANAFAYGYFQTARWKDDRGWVGGYRLDWQQSLGDPPFYLVPFVEMRGIPAARYQGRTTLLIETDQRIDFTRRWSGVFFGGLARAFDHASEFDDADRVYGVGAGFRYLIARKFKMRMGVDIARGPEEWAYYLIVGNAWVR